VKILAQQVSKQFTKAAIQEITTLGNGLINDTFLVKTEQSTFVLQRINTQVFPNPSLIMENLNLLSGHIKKKTAIKLTIPRALKTRSQQPYFNDENNNFWRALEFVENTESKEQLSNPKQAEQIGFALGHFHRLLSDADTTFFHDTLPGFHITPHYFLQYQAIEKNNQKESQVKKVQQCKEFIDQFSVKINSLEQAKQQGLLIERITHGDPKLNNFLFTRNSNIIISLIDLDTIKPGLVHYDIADCLRSCCHNTALNTFDLKLCKTILSSYLKEMADIFTDSDYEYLYPAIELIPFELGLRFFTDYLQGNQYFKVDSAEQNLDRAWAQFQLCKNIGEQEEEIKGLIYN